ncbi:MAG: polymer-forming cytoskeletal protein [Anaerolineae bacterium]|nr:polymer-forming cytoskeletal protein [Anaerolineae bacterium]
MTLRRALPLLLVLVLLLLPLSVVTAQGGQGAFALTDRYTLSEGEVVDGDLAVVASEIVLEPGSRVAGNAALIGGTVTMRGTVTGDLAVLGDNVTLGSGALVTGDAVVCSNNIQRDDRALISGDYSASCDTVGGLLENVAPVAFDPSKWDWGNFDPTTWDWGGGLERLSEIDIEGPSPVERLGMSTLFALAMGSFAALVALVMPQRLRRMSDAVLRFPLATGAVGFMTFIVSVVISGLVIVSLFLVVTACLLPFLALAWIGLALLMAVGWVAVGLPVGAWLLGVLNMERVSPAAAAAVGTLVLTFGVGLLGISPWTMLFWGLLGLSLAGWGLGGAVLTRLGGHPYPRPMPT